MPGIILGDGIILGAGINLGSGTGPEPPAPVPGVDNQIGYPEMDPPVIAGIQLEDVTATVNNPYGFTINDDNATGVVVANLSASNQTFFATYGTGTKTCAWGSGSTAVSSTINVVTNSGPTLVFYIQGQTGPATYNYPFIFGDPVGQETYVTSGSYSFIVPAGVTSICGLVMGGGGAGAPSITNGTSTGGGGGGGGLSWKNNISVTPGETLSVVVGAAGTGSLNYIGNSGGLSKIQRGGTVLLLANGGTGGTGNNGSRSAPWAGGASGTGGTTVDPSYGGGNGGTGGNGTAGANTYRPGGGGAAGYTGNGGTGGNGGPSYNAGASGAGGGAGGGASTPNAPYSGGGGGVGIYGQGSNGAGGVTGDGVGKGGSGGGNGYGISTGGIYGGGGAGSVGTLYGAGSSGAVRIIWGEGRNYPSTNTGNV